MEGRTLFLFPTEAEAAPFRALRPDAAVAIIGVGIAEAAAGTAAQMVVTDPTRVVLCGIAGACDDRLSVGQVVEVVSDRVEGLPDAYTFEYENDPVTGLEQVRTLTVNRSGDAMRNQTNFDYEDFCHIRAVSNRVGEPFEQWRVGEAVAALAAVASQLFTE